MLGRGKLGKEEDVETFDNYLRGHIRTSNKSINIRGLFRVPDVSGGERLMISAEEKEPQLPHEEQKLHIPMDSANDETWNKLPGEPNEPLPSISKAMMSYPLRKPLSLHPPK